MNSEVRTRRRRVRKRSSRISDSRRCERARGGHLRARGQDVAYTREIYPGERAQRYDWDAVTDQAEQAYQRAIDGTW